MITQIKNQWSRDKLFVLSGGITLFITLPTVVMLCIITPEILVGLFITVMIMSALYFVLCLGLDNL